MRRCLSLVLAFAMVFTMLVIPAYAAETPTATVTATYATGVAPTAAGEVFVVTIGLENVSTNTFKSGMVAWNWPAEVASLVDYMTIEDAEPYILTNDDALAGYHVGNQLNPFAGRSGKFTIAPSSSTDITTGYSCAGLYIDNSARDKSIETLTDGACALFDIAFVLNEGYTADDFYLAISDSNSTKLILSDEDANESTVANGGLTLKSSIEKKEEVIYYNSKHQPGVNSQDVDGVYELPEALTAGKTYEVYFTVETSGAQANTLIGLNNAAQMTASNYFGNSTIMMKIDGTNIVFRNGGDAPSVGTLAAAQTTVDVKVVVDLINNTWDATYTENGVVVAEKAGMSFRNANIPIDALVLCDNNSVENCLWVNADSIRIVDTTPASVGDVVFKYVDAEGNALEETKMSGETGTEVSVVAKTITVGGVKYEAPAASGVVGTDAEVTVTCAKVEVVTISYTINGEVVSTATVEGVDGAEVAYASGNVVAADGVYAAVGTLTVDAENLEVEVALEAVALGLVSAAGQSADAVHTLEKQMTTAGTVTFDLTVLNIKDTLVALDNAAALADNYFAQSSAYIQFKGGNIMVNDGSGVQNIAVYELGKTYSVEFVLDVENYTYTVTIMDGDAVVATVENFGMRNDVAPIDSLVILDNAGAGAGAVVVSNLVVETEDEQPTDEPSSDEPTDEPSSDEPTDEPSSDEPTDEPSSDEPSDEPSSDEPSDEPSSDEPSDEPSSDEPSDEPSEEPGEDLPFEAVDVVVTSTALGVTITGKFVDVDTTETSVVVVISYLKDGAAYCIQAVEVPVINGEVAVPNSTVTITDGELSVAGISLLTGVDALQAITEGNLGTPVGVWK